MRHTVVKEKHIDYSDVSNWKGYVMVGDQAYQDRVRGLLKAELKKRNLTYKDLAERLTAAGNPDGAANIANKISRGSFSAAYFVQCLEAIGCKNLSLTIE